MKKEEILAKFRKDMEQRGRSPHTVEEYETKIRLYQDYYDKAADEMGIEEMQGYLHYLLTEKKLSASTVNVYNSAIRFVYGVTLDVTLNYKKLTRVPQRRRLPQLFTRAEISSS